MNLKYGTLVKIVNSSEFWNNSLGTVISWHTEGISEHKDAAEDYYTVQLAYGNKIDCKEDQLEKVDEYGNQI